MTTLIIYIVLILALSAFFSGMEIAFVSSNKLRFEMERAQSTFSARLASTFFEHPNSFISTLLVGNNIALVIYGILIARLLEPTVIRPLGIQNEWVALLTQTIISTLIVLVTGEFIPKTLFKINPNRALTFFAPLAYLFYIILYPISKFTGGLAKLLLRIFGLKVAQTDSDSAFSKVDLDFLIQSSIDQSDNDEEIEDEVKIFQNALDFSNCKVRDCIVPRTEIVAVDVTESLEQLKSKFIESGCSKIIVYDDERLAEEQGVFRPADVERVAQLRKILRLYVVALRREGGRHARAVEIEQQPELPAGIVQGLQLGAFLRSQHDDGDVAQLLVVSDLIQDLKAVHDRHHQVQQDQGYAFRVGPDLLHGLPAVFGI